MGYYNFYAKQDITHLGNKLAEMDVFKKYKIIVTNVKIKSNFIEVLEIGPGRTLWSRNRF